MLCSILNIYISLSNYLSVKNWDYGQDYLMLLAMLLWVSNKSFYLLLYLVKY